MANYRTSRILPIILVIVIVIIAIAAIVSLARVVFFSGSGEPVEIDNSRAALLDTGSSRSVVMTVRGPIVADEEFHSYRIAVSASSRQLTTYNGYLGVIRENVSLSNNTVAYDQFVHALDKADLAVGRQFEGDRNDVRGVCATGRVYEFSILNKAESVKYLWTSTCKGSLGSLDASVEQLNDLFVDQIPGATAVIKNVKL